MAQCTKHEDPTMIEVLGTQGLDPAGFTPTEFDKLIRVEIDKWRIKGE